MVGAEMKLIWLLFLYNYNYTKLTLHIMEEVVSYAGLEKNGLCAPVSVLPWLPVFIFKHMWYT